MIKINDMKKIFYLFYFLCISSFSIAQNNKPVVNVYVDNTGSMFGYISKGNEFEWTISNLLTSINLSELTYDENIHLHYINSAIFPYRGTPANFLNGVTIRNASTYRGDLGKTCMSNFFSKVLDRTSGDTISIIISDFIISPGQGADATTVLAAEKNAISNIVKSALNKYPDLSVAMYRMLSTFNGKFYDCQDHYKQINTTRPYYMCVISNRSLISAFRSEVRYGSLDNGHGESAVTNSYVFFNINSNRDPKYTILSTSSGHIIEGSKGVKRVRLGNDKKYRFTIAIDLSQYGLLGNYLTQNSSYSLNNPLYQITKVEKMQGVGTTHRVHIETSTNPTPCQLTITLKNKVPSWVESYNVDSNDCDQVFNEENLDKTFGIKTIADAVFNAFYYNKSDLLKVAVTINQ